MQRSPARQKAIEDGKGRYFTGVPCSRGHVSERYTSSSCCVECSKGKRSRAIEADPEKARAMEIRHSKRSYEANKEKILLRNREYHRRRYAEDKDFRENIIEKTKAYYAENKASLSISRKAYRESVKDAIAAYKKAYRTKNIDRMRAHCRNRKARLKNADGVHTRECIDSLLALQGNRCASCRCNLVGNGYEVDHIHPLSKGGSNDRSNLQILCAPCNRTKSSKDPYDWAKEKGLLI